MIVLNLICGAGHRFEAWFASAAAYDDQLSSGLVACPHCQDKSVSRLPCAPHVLRGTSADRQVPAADAEMLAEAIARLTADTDDVGNRFPEEARRIHYEEVPARRIRGHASLSDTLDLIEEGIPVLPIPGLGNKTRH